MSLHRDDASRFLVTVLRDDPESLSDDRNDVWIPKAVVAFVYKSTGKPMLSDDPASFDLYPVFHDAAWDLARRGILRPTEFYPKAAIRPTEFKRGAGYCLTEAGRSKLTELADQPWVPTEPSRYWGALKRFSANYGAGFEQRAHEAARCYETGNYLACCAVCGAAAESMLLAAAVTTHDPVAVLRDYRSANGTRKIIDRVTTRVKGARQQALRDSFNILGYWRNEAAHGEVTPVSEIEAHEALARLLTLAQSVCRDWNDISGYLNP